MSREVKERNYLLLSVFLRKAENHKPGNNTRVAQTSDRISFDTFLEKR